MNRRGFLTACIVRKWKMIDILIEFSPVIALLIVGAIMLFAIFILIRK